MRHKYSFFLKTVPFLLSLLALASYSIKLSANTYTVTNTSNAGNGSLRKAIQNANSNAGADVINFNIPGSGPQTITLNSNLDSATGQVTIDGTTQPGYAGTPLIVIDGTNCGASGTGIILGVGSSNSIVKGLCIQNCQQFGIWITDGGSSNNTITSCYIGCDYTGLSSAPNGLGIFIAGGAGNIIGGTGGSATRNIISGNSSSLGLGYGIEIIGPASSTSVLGNYIGVGANGTTSLGNGSTGVFSSAPNTSIGNGLAGGGNVVSANGGEGVQLAVGADNSTVYGNYLGTNATGTTAMGNSNTGLYLSGANNVTVGGTTSLLRNIISGNLAFGGIEAVSGSGAVIQGNYIGLNAAGTAAVGNNVSGITLDGMFGFTVVDNIVSGNTGSNGYGISITAGTGGIVKHNYIGLNAAGAAAIPNAKSGLRITTTSAKTIGGTSAGDGNYIAGNSENGIILSSGSSHIIEGNFIGLNVSGAAVANGLDGVLISGANCTFGVAAAGGTNYVAGNTANGINITSSGAKVYNSYIGLNASGSVVANGQSGVKISGNTATVGGFAANQGCVISGNAGNGINQISGTSASIMGNIIGLNPGATASIANGGVGIVCGGGSATIGGTATNQSNIISGNTGKGVVVTGTTTNVKISGNSIYGNGASPQIDLNNDGVSLNDDGDADSGPNGKQNFPVLTSVATGSGVTNISGTLNSAASTSYSVEFFANSSKDNIGYGPGKTYIGNTSVTTDASGNATFTATITGTYSNISATASSSNATSEFSATVNLVFSSFPTICPGATVAHLNYVSSVGNPVNYRITWDAGALSAGFTNVVATTVPVSPISVTVPANTGDGVYTGTMIVDDGTVNSPAIPVSVTISAPSIAMGSAPSVCFGTSSAAFNYSDTGGNPDLYKITWSTAAVGAGFSSTGFSALTSSLPFNMPSGAPAATYNGTLTIKNSVTGCATDTPVSVTVRTMPVVNSVSNVTRCNGLSIGSITFTGTATSYSWSNNNTSIGLAASGTDSVAGFTATNTTSTPQVATVTVTPSALGCTGADSSFTITVYPTPDISGHANQNVCNNTIAVAENFNSTVTGTTFTWTNSNTSVGLGASGTGSIGVFTVTNSGSATQIATVTVTPSANGCDGAAQNFTYTVYPTPDVAGLADQAKCNNNIALAETFNGSVAGTTYAWTNSNTSIGLGASGSGSIGIFTVTNSGTATEVATVTVTPSANGCNGSAENFTYTAYPTPGITGYSDQSICNSAVAVAENFSSAVSGTTFTWTNNNTSVGLGASGTGSIGVFTVTNSGSATQIAAVTVTPSANGCNGAAQNFTYTAYPTPDVTGLADQAKCNNNIALAETFNGSVAGTTYTWTNSDASIGLAASGAGSIGIFTVTNSGTATQVATVTVTPSANGCNGVAQNFTYTVYPTPGITGYSDQSICNSAVAVAENFSSAVSGTTFTWTNSNTSIGLDASGTGSIGVFTVINGGSATQIATVTVTPSANGCNGAAQNFTYTAYPTPDVTGLADQAICNNNTALAETFNGSVAGTTYTWTNSNTSIGLAASGTGSIGTFTVTNGGASVQIATVTVTPSANTCAGTTQTFTYTAYPTPDVSGFTSQAKCNGEATIAENFSGSVSGTTYTWTNDNSTIGLALSGSGSSISSFTAVNTNSVATTANVTVTPTANGCAGIPQTFVYTVNPTPGVDVVSGQVLCDGAATASVVFTGTVVGTSYTWTNSDASIGLATSGSDSVGSFIATNGGPASHVATVTVTPATSTCAGQSQSFTFTVHPRPVATGFASQVVCNGLSTSAENFSSAVTGCTYAWTNSDNTIGLASSGTGNIPAFTATNSLYVAVVSSVTVTASANGCLGIPQTFTYKVNPTPDVAAVSNQAICNTNATSVINFTGHVASTTFSWVNDMPGIGLSATGTGDIASFTASNTTSIILIDTITVTPTANGCVGNPQMFTITVKPTPIVNTVADQTVCNNNLASVNFTGPVVGTLFAWSNNNPAIGLAASGSGNIAPFTAINTGTAASTATVTVSPSADGCIGAAKTFTINVNPTPQLSSSVSLSDSICSGISYTKTLASATTGTTFSWARNTAANISNPAGSGIGASINETLINTATIAANTQYVISLSAAGCSNTQTINVKVNPGVQTPVISVAPSHNQISNILYQNFGAQVAPPAGVKYTWSANSATVWAVGGTQQYALVNFNTPASTAIVTLTAESITTGCFSITADSVNVAGGSAAYPSLIYSFGQFICLTNDVDGYQWGYDDAATLDSTILTGEINQTYINQSPDANKYYWVMVRHNGYVEKAYLATHMPLGVSDVNAMAIDVNIYPNPANGLVNIEISNQGSNEMEIQFENLLGQKILTVPGTGHKTQVDISNLPGGMYIVNCYVNGLNVHSGRVIKN